MNNIDIGAIYTHSLAGAILIHWRTMTFAVSIAVVDKPRWAVTAYSAARRVGACFPPVAPAVVVQALVHV